MKLRTVLPFILGMLLALAPLFAGDVYVKQSDQGIVLGNDSLEIALDTATGALKLASVRNKIGPSPKLADDGFSLQVNETQELAASSFQVVGREVADLDGDGKRVSILLRNKETGIEARIVYEVRKDDFFARRRLMVREPSGEKEIVLGKAQIERLSTDAKLDLGGMGQPVFVGDGLFIGLEHPAAQNRGQDGKVCLFHYPGKKIGKEFLELKSEVIGVARAGGVEDAFAEYLHRIRLPARSFVLYNSWYDIRSKEMNTDVFIECYNGFKKALVDPYGVKLDSFVVDDGYQDKKSIWKTDKALLPDDFTPLAQHLKANGSCFGIWMPLTPVKGNLDLEWGREQGYEVSSTGGCYCISGPKFNAALREIIAYHIKTFGLNYYKHDFNSFTCAAPGHGHLPKNEYGFEANVDAYIEVLKYSRSLNPDIFLNVTGGMWLSPWWLMYADTVWRGGGDTGREGVVPYIEQRDDTMTYVDAVLWDDFVKFRYQFPSSALMTHGIVYARLCMLGGKDEPLHRWAEHVVAYLAPGLMMKELYLTPRLVREDQWAVLGPALAWAEQEKAVLVETKMTHGNPHLGEVYGYRHVKDGRLIWFLRNPSMNAQKVDLALAEAIGGAPARADVIYPYRMVLPTEAGVSLEVPPYQTLAVEADRADAVSDLRVAGCRYSVAEEAGGRITCDLIGPPGAKAAVTLKCPVPIREAALDGAPLPGVKGKEAAFDVTFEGAAQECALEDVSPDRGGNVNQIKVTVSTNVPDARLGILCEKILNVVPMGKILLNGKEVKPTVMHGEGWRFYLVALPAGSNEVSYQVPLAKRATVPFSPKEMTVSAWLFTRTELPKRRLVLTLEGDLPARKRPATPFANVNPASRMAQDRRVVRTILPGEEARITADDLSKIRAAKLHVNVFGVNGEEKFVQKPVLLNGAEIGILPPNGHSLDKWEERAMDIPKEMLPTIKPENTVVFTNPTHDPFKISEIGLAVQLADGTWVETNRETGIHCSTPGWLYTEGKVFKADRSEAIPLSLPVK